VSAEAAKARESGRVDEAIALYRRAVTMRPAWAEGQWYLGTLLYEQGRPRDARAAFGRLIRAHPDHAGGFAMDGLCAFQLGAHEEALRLLLRARQLNVQRTAELATVVRYHTGILLTRFGEYEAGNQVLTELAVDGQQSPQAIEAFGLNVLRLPLLPGEVPTDGRARVELAGRAGFAMAARQVAQARPLLEALVATYGDTPHVHYVWGVFLLAEDPSRAMDAFRREIATSPTHVPARLQLAFELVKQGDAAAARPYAEQAVALDPQQFAPRLALGQVHLGLGDTASAIAELEQAVRLAPGSAQPHYVLAVAYARAGRRADAERARQAFARLSASGGTSK
jgi:tetratricopeptide (TPR) repeat protein